MQRGGTSSRANLRIAQPGDRPFVATTTTVDGSCGMFRIDHGSLGSAIDIGLDAPNILRRRCVRARASSNGTAGRGIGRRNFL